jgi:hypothetical protein
MALRPDEQLLWAGRPNGRGHAPLHSSVYLIWGLILFATLVLSIVEVGLDVVSIAIGLTPPLIVFTMIWLVFKALARKFARPESDAFLLTRGRAIHVFIEGQTTNVASVPLDGQTKVELSKQSGDKGTLLIKRKPAPGEPVATLPLLRTRRSAWSGVRFSCVPQAEYVRQVANWAIDQNRQRSASPASR